MLTPVVRILLILNGLVFVAQIVAARPLMLWLALWPIGLFGPEDGAFPFQPWQILTYAFLHGGIAHLALNMYALWMFGTRLEYRWGSRAFLAFYLACVAGAALTQLLESEIALARGGAAYPVLGASGGVFGVLLAFGLTYPEVRLMLLFPPVSVKAKWFVLGYGAVELLAGVTGTATGVAHFAHLGGMLTGWLVLRGWHPGGGGDSPRRRR